MTDKQTLIKTLALAPHTEGGYFRRTYEAPRQRDFGWGERFSMTSILYLLTDDSPIGHWHLNRADIVHYFHLGHAIEYFVISPDGLLTQHTMGTDLAADQRLQLTVPGGHWKASILTGGSFGLISEAVSPGFDFADMQMGAEAHLVAQFPHLEAEIRRYCKPGVGAS